MNLIAPFYGKENTNRQEEDLLKTIQLSSGSNRNKKVFLSLLLGLILAIICYPASTLADDDRYVEIRMVIIDAEVLPDGSIVVEEERTYYFGGGTFFGADQWFYFKDDVTYDDFYIKEGDNYYTEVDTFPTSEAGTYSTRLHEDHVVLDYSFYATTQERTFTIGYVLQDAVTVHNDVAEIYHQFIGDEWDQETEYALVNLKLPEGAEKDDIKAWGHGPLHGEVTIHAPDQITWEVEELSPRRFLEVRTVFPPELVPDATKKTGEDGLANILAEEERWARQANFERTLHRIQWIFAPILFLFLIIFSIITFRKIRKGINAYEGDYYRELPGDYTPAVAGYLFRHAKTGTEDFTATIMDLARRKYIHIEEVSTEKGLLKKEVTDYLILKRKDPEGLAPHEEKLMDFLFNKIAPTSKWKEKVKRAEHETEHSSTEETGLTFEDIKNYTRKYKESGKNFFHGWNGNITKLAQKQNFFEKKLTRLQYGGIIAGAALLILGFALMFLTEFFLLATISIITGGLMVFLMYLAGKPFTEYGADQISKWRAFKNYLLHFSSMEESTVPSLIIWEHYLVYAVVLGVAKEVMKQLTVVFPDLEEQSRHMGMSWYYMGMMRRGDFTSSFDRLNNSFSSTMKDSRNAAFASSSSSGSGGGGGFSGGGGGGSGGGGGGFR